MIFQERTYSVLIVSASEKFNNTARSLLKPTDYWPVSAASSVGEARRRLNDRPCDLLLINGPLPDDLGLQLAMDACANSDAGVLLLVRSEIYDEIYAKALPYGVIVLPKPTSLPMVAQTLRVLCATRERLRRLEQRQASVEERIAEIRLVNRAKLLLIQRKDLSEEDAHRYIEKQAMDRRVSKREVAESIIRGCG
ncbi:MAG: ANTAR domain-containing protein [Firmicutes bacterium]|nr:ANTAR domain-containing protein [Bacillota bacterium]MBR2784294.1 ANTAR domain-containing protein [Bacillota bacterium]